jgi:ABC-type amino acid transport substrate-binding protein
VRSLQVKKKPKRKPKRKVVKKWAHVQYFYCTDGETPEQFQDRINNWFKQLSKDGFYYSTEFDYFNEGSGVYFIRVILEEKIPR